MSTSPAETLAALGSEAAWLDTATALPTDKLGTYRYDLHPLTADVILDLSRLILDGWSAYVVQGLSGTVRIITRPPAHGVGASASQKVSTPGASAGSGLSLPGGGTPSRVRAREAGVSW
ncbi:hypothetical protein [Microbacterium sp. HJ5]